MNDLDLIKRAIRNNGSAQLFKYAICILAVFVAAISLLTGG